VSNQLAATDDLNRLPCRNPIEITPRTLSQFAKLDPLTSVRRDRGHPRITGRHDPRQ
jgi:hypothetical protein